MTGLPYADRDAVLALGPAAAVAAIEAALRQGLDPAAGAPRTAFGVAAGELLMMPAASESYVGVKLAAVAPANPARGLPRIGAVYVLFDAGTLQPAALLDGVALTDLRTPAVSVAAVRPWLQRIGRPARVVVFGAGPQGLGHLATVAAVIPVESAVLVVRSPDRAQAPGSVLGTVLPPIRVLAADDDEVASVLAGADVVVCATTAREPLFDSSLLGEACVVMAVGSHEPDAREVDADWSRRATVVVEDVDTAMREGGDVVQAVLERTVTVDQLVPMADVVLGLIPVEGPVLFKGSGMSWEDLVVAEAVLAG